MHPSTNKPMLGESQLMLELTEQISRVAPLKKPLLILGERGTGKELVAARIHYLSQRWDQPFLKVNCAAMNDNLLESELFGHENGAFTGATRRHIGRFERAEGGTLFLDELATCSTQVQEKLLRIVEYGEYERLGGQQTLQADVRLLAATNADLIALTEKEKFRADLLDRLAFDVIHIPPLRERPEDILLLAEHFALSICQELERSYFPGFSSRAKQQLLDHHWPGNVRELRNTIERSVYRQQQGDTPIDQLIVNPFIPPWQKKKNLAKTTSQPEKADKPSNTQLSQQVAELEQQLLIEALEQHQYNQKQAAEQLGLSYHQLRAQLRKHGMIPLRRFLQERDKP